MRKLPERPTRTRKKHTISYPGEIEEEVSQRIARLGMTFQQYVESLVAFDMILEKPHIITGPHIRTGRESAWRLWVEIIAEFENPKKDFRAYTEMFLERVLQRSIQLQDSELTEKAPAS